ncbi:hypothetical protein DB41_GU00190 [Neochlamydia sp. TUME1]|nr:hypothetical protein DB41_GU00190 [Neochlamydia sp. TUME1]
MAKSTLKTRPIFHWAPLRIKAHLLLCFINLFLERFLESLLRQNNVYLTLDRIRHALAQVHTTIFEDRSAKREGSMQSLLCQDAQAILQVLGIPTQRNTTFQSQCCA